jgi:TolB-like protein
MAEGGGDDERAGGYMRTVFISYASQDVAVANAVVDALERDGLKCWIAPRDVVPGEFYAGAIVHAIDATSVIVLILSENAATSQHILREVERAGSKRHPMVALRIDSAKMPADLEYFLNSSHWLDARAVGIENALPKLIDAVHHLLVPASAAEHQAHLVVDKVWMSKRTDTEMPISFVARTAAPATPAIPEKSVAVLPFLDMSEKKDQEYFSDGLSEELINMLTKVPELRVPARTSSFYFKGKQATIADIAKALAVAHVLEGSVRKSGNTLRITAQLVRVDNGYHVWSETYDRKLDDIFKIQDEIAGAVVTALKVHLLPQQQAAQEELRTANIAAYNLYLQGRQSYNQGDAAGHQGAVTAFRAATALDSRYAAAYADLAVAQMWVADHTGSTADYESAIGAAEKAVALAPGLAAGYSARGFVSAAYRFDFAGAQADLDKAVALNPTDASVLHRSALMLAFLGKLPAAIAREEQALALDPLSSEICMRLGFFLVANEQLAQARSLYEKALAIAPNSVRASFHLGKLALLGVSEILCVSRMINSLAQHKSIFELDSQLCLGSMP